ncbi:galactose oxidase-like domain-containing protein [Streptomyces monticola]|uniref:Galactose oxidase-like domain-containing protein n=1 Tax=Streptomyces monticola TaxID=2666263 RepID=A0ABW2JU42_9ACTN
MEHRPEYLDVSLAEVRAGSNVLRLRVHAVQGRVRADKAVPLRLGTSRDESLSLSVTSETGLTTVGVSRRAAEQSGSVAVTVSAGRPATVWVVARGVGAPQVPGDRLTVRSPHGALTIEVWIEPVGGQWQPAGKAGTSLDLGIVAVHAALMRKGTGAENIMLSGARKRNEDGSFKPDPKHKGQWLWNVKAMGDLESRALDLDTLRSQERPMDGVGGTPKKNLFCAGHAHLPDGRLLIAGGHIVHDPDNHEQPPGNDGDRVYIYDPQRTPGYTLQEDVLLNPPRWYPTVTALPDGLMLIAGGSSDCQYTKQYWERINNDYLLFDPATGRVLDLGKVDLIAAKTIPKKDRLATYPAVFVLPTNHADGTVIALAETNKAWLYHYRTRQPLRRAAKHYRMHTKGSRSYPTYGSFVLLPLEPGSSKARILAVGGQHETKRDHRDDTVTQKSTATAEILDIDTSRDLAKQQGWRKIASLSHRRFLCDATLLADGTVLISGGASHGWVSHNEHPVNAAELFDPVTEAFTPAATARTDRRYHATALLQPDGTVLKMGSTGGYGADDEEVAEWLRAHTDAERYLPPYLWRGPRPVITRVTDRAGSPTLAADTNPTLHYGQDIGLAARGEGLDNKSRVALIRPGAVTHGFDHDQRYVWLDTTCTPSDDGWRIVAKLPLNQAAAPPGDYLLVLVDGHGVPSETRWVRVAAAGA